MIVNFLESLYIIFLCVQNKVLSKQKLPCMLAWAINNEILNLSLKIDSYGKIVADFCKLAERYFKNNFHQWRTKSVVPTYLARKRISPHKIKFYAYECMATKKPENSIIHYSVYNFYSDRTFDAISDHICLRTPLCKN